MLVNRVSARLALTGALAALVGALASCGPSRSAAPVTVPSIRGLTPLLTWMGENTHPAGTGYASLGADSGRYGSISGLAPDGGSGQWVGVIDDRVDTRVAWIDITYGDAGLQVTPRRLMPLSAGPGMRTEMVTEADLEAIAALPDGSFLLSEEGHRARAGVWQPAILHMTREGVVTDALAYPEAFQIQDDTRGLRDNQGFESLAVMPGGRLIAGLEQPLIEDGPVTSFEHGGAGRLIEFERRGAGWRPGRQWQYPIDPTPHPEGFDRICDDGENGLVDLLALSDTMLLAMERACLLDQSDRAANTIMLFAVELERGTVRKTRLLDLSSLRDRLSPALSRLDNFEALAFGPPSPLGRTLLIASDDNFRRTQVSSFLLFGLRY